MKEVRLPSFAYSENLNIAAEPEQPAIPDNISLLDLAEQVVRGKVKLTTQQASMLKELLPFHANKRPTREKKDDKDFAVKLDRGIERSRTPEGRVNKMDKARAQVDDED